jgi:hypothetical protein
MKQQNVASDSIWPFFAEHDQEKDRGIMLVASLLCVFWVAVVSYFYLLIRIGAKRSPLPARLIPSRRVLHRVVSERSERVVVISHFMVHRR